MLGRFVAAGESRRDEIGSGLFLLHYPDGTMRIEHTCDRGPRGVIVCAPEISTEPGWHTIVCADPLTISPSILCADCGLHGYVREGRWVGA